MKEIRDAKIIDHLIYVNLFDDLKSNELEQVAKYLRLIEFDANEMLFRESAKGEFACFIVDGELQVLKGEPGSEVEIATLTRGRSIGEMSIIDRFPRSASVRSVTSGKLIMLHKDQFEELLDEHPRIGVRLLLRVSRLMSLNLRKTSALLAEVLPVAGEV